MECSTYWSNYYKHHIIIFDCYEKGINRGIKDPNSRAPFCQSVGTGTPTPDEKTFERRKASSSTRFLLSDFMSLQLQLPPSSRQVTMQDINGLAGRAIENQAPNGPKDRLDGYRLDRWLGHQRGRHFPGSRVQAPSCPHPVHPSPECPSREGSDDSICKLRNVT